MISQTITACALRAAVSLAMCSFVGCAGSTKISAPQATYALSVEFITPPQRVLSTVVIATGVNAPFAVTAKDDAGNEYMVSGTLRRKTSRTFSLEGIHVELRVKGSIRFSAGGPDEIELGQDFGWREGGPALGIGYKVSLSTSDDPGPARTKSVPRAGDRDPDHRAP